MYRYADISKFTQAEINQLWKNARRVVKHPSIHILKAPALKAEGRMLIVIPRKIGSAPERNLARRRLKALFYEHKLFSRGYDLIALAKPGLPALEFQSLQALLLQAVAENAAP